MDFTEFPKIARLARDIVVTEKIDGTNAQVCIVDTRVDTVASPALAFSGDYAIHAGSRTKWITPTDDNYGFAKWVLANSEELFKLGVGNHFGEWWGQGIQRNYGLKEKRFSLFNVSRWGDTTTRPTCCWVVPTLYTGVFDMHSIEGCLHRLQDEGSVAAPGFMKPEGVVIFHTAGGYLFKKTIEKDEQPKGMK